MNKHKKTLTKLAKSKTEVKRFTVYRDRWLRGNGKAGNTKMEVEDSSLYDPTTKTMCCLGFLCRTAGILVEDLKGVAVPGSVDAKILNSSRYPATLNNNKKGYFNEEVLEELVSINDDTLIRDRTRERELTALFAQAGITVTFKDGKGYW